MNQGLGNLLMQVGFATHTGRRQQNQDNGLVDESTSLYAVADGVGGGDSGEVASASVCQSMQRAVHAGHPLEQAILLAHQSLLGDDISGERGYAASTVVALHAHSDEMEVAWVGDSRVYLLRDDLIMQMTEDHSVAQRSTGLSEEEAARIRHVLTQAVGAAGESGLHVDAYRVPRQAGDVWLMCSDGLHGVVSEERIQEVLARRGNSQSKADELVEIALTNGADDNVTVLVVTDKDGAPHSKATPKRDLSGEKTRPMPPFAEPNASQSASGRPWRYMALGGILAALLFLALAFAL
ncbi:serine/threonine-protein phosphatase [Hahella sp. KA22]|nr:serine/threonine-protein phosphatase [Hahella sp. KA22]QAY52826.1 serine/threonine-protein phosphatase [Hahella sp. KA22]